MKIKVTPNQVKIEWLGKIEISTCEELVSLFNNADERERRRLAIIHFDTGVFDVVEKEEKAVVKHKLTIKNYSDIGRYISDDDLDNIDNPHWIVE